MVVTPDSATLAARPALPAAAGLPVAVRLRAFPVRRLRRWLGVLGLLVAAGYLAAVVDPGELGVALAAVADRPAALLGAVVLYAGAFLLRSLAWRRVLPGLSTGQSWAALHVSLLGNHLLPFRLGEALRVTSVLRRTPLPTAPVAASAVALRAADLLAVLALAAVAAPAVAGGFGVSGWLLAAALLAAGVAAVGWLVALRRRGAAVRLPGGVVALAASAAWLLAAALVAHATKTAYALVVGGVGLVTPAPGYFGRLRLPRTPPSRPAAAVPAPDAPVVAVIPVHDEAATVGDVVRRLPAVACGRPVRTIVVDDGSTDGSAALAAAAGAAVVAQPGNLGLGAAVRRALAEA